MKILTTLASYSGNSNPYIKEVITLDRDDKKRLGKHHGVLGTLNLIQDLRKQKFDKSFIELLFIY